MKTALVFFVPGGKPNALIERLEKGLANGNTTELIPVQAAAEQVAKKSFFDRSKQAQLKLVSTKTDLSAFDLVVFASTVEGMMPKRRLPAEMELYLKECRGIENKSVAFCVMAFGMAGRVPQKMTSILHTRNATVKSSEVFTFLVNFSKEQLATADAFTKKLVS